LAGVYLSYGGKAYKNFSVFSISEIGNENIGFQLQCTTANSPCCMDFQHRRGDWFFPNTSLVPGKKQEAEPKTFYRNRGDNGTVNLNRQNTDIIYPTGLFCCEVPDDDDINQTLCANIGKIFYFLNNNVVIVIIHNYYEQ
jgi:hypothetical protein